MTYGPSKLKPVCKIVQKALAKESRVLFPNNNKMDELYL